MITQGECGRVGSGKAERPPPTSTTAGRAEETFCSRFGLPTVQTSPRASLARQTPVTHNIPIEEDPKNDRFTEGDETSSRRESGVASHS
jgi:hypothetical protein